MKHEVTFRGRSGVTLVDADVVGANKLGFIVFAKSSALVSVEPETVLLANPAEVISIRPVKDSDIAVVPAGTIIEVAK